MKKQLTLLTLILLAALALNAQVAINTDGSTADPSAMLDVKSTTAGLLIPRTDTTTVNNAHSGSLIAGLLIYQNSDNTFYYYDGGKWTKLAADKHLVFERNGIVIRPKGDYWGDFILGRDSLPQKGKVITANLLFFNISKYAFRVGRLVDSPNWSPDSIGSGSFAFGKNTKAKGYLSTAWGDYTNASGRASTAWGQAGIASNEYCTVWGVYDTASGYNSTAWGYQTKAPSYCETVLGSFNTEYSPSSTHYWRLGDRLFVIGNGTSGNRSNALTLIKNGNLGLNTDNPEVELNIVDSQDSDNDVVLRMQSHNSNNDAIIEFYEGNAEAMSLHYDGGDNALYFVDLAQSPDEKRLKIVRSTGSIIPQEDKVANLGTSTLAWNYIYYHHLINEGAAAFTDREVTKELLNHPPKQKPAGVVDEKTEKGLKALDPNSVPPALKDGSYLLTDEMTTYNYKANYEQQVIIEKLNKKVESQKNKIESQKNKIESLEKRIERLESLIENK